MIFLKLISVSRYLKLSSYILVVNNLYIKSCTLSFSNNVTSKPPNRESDTEAVMSRTITVEDVVNFSKLSGDTNPIHSSHSSENAIVHGAFLNSIVSGVIGTKLPGPGCIVVQQTLNFPNKCYVGETVEVTVKLIENRKIIGVNFRCSVKEKNKTVLFGSAKLVMSRLNS